MGYFHWVTWREKEKEKGTQRREREREKGDEYVIYYDECSIVDALLCVLQVFGIDKNLFHNPDIWMVFLEKSEHQKFFFKHWADFLTFWMSISKKLKTDWMKKSLSLCGTYLWSLRWSCRRNDLKHISHVYGRSSVCVRTWINKL